MKYMAFCGERKGGDFLSMFKKVQWVYLLTKYMNVAFDS
jgi:hypothetical protein